MSTESECPKVELNHFLPVLESLSRGETKEVLDYLEQIGLSEEQIEALGLGEATTNSGLFNEIGKLTRTLHDSLSDFKEQVGKLTEKGTVLEIVDAAISLDSVISMTEKAATNVMELVEQQSALLVSHKNDAKKLLSALQEDGSEPPTQEELTAFIESSVKTDTEILSLNMKIIMSQEFQDLTGQVLQKVTRLIGDVETNLVDLIQTFGTVVDTRSAEDHPEPAVVTAPAEEQKSGGEDQDSIDALLGSFGF